MTKRVEVSRKEDVFRRGSFRVEEAHLRYERYDGAMTDDTVRLNFERGDSVAAILHDPRADSVVLVEQFRYPTYAKGPGWILELPAGMVDRKDEATQEVTMRRELMEEAGYRVDSLRHVMTFYVSPGGSSERILLYYAQITPEQRVGRGGGMPEDAEDIRVVSLPFADALHKVAIGEIVDAKTIIGLQWLQAHHEELGAGQA
jgi:ADP-ribose pyrophosphatase